MIKEKKLIKLVKEKGDKPAAEEIINFYYESIYINVFKQIADREIAKDLTQEIFISVLKSIGNYEEKKSSFKTWIYKIASNKVVDYYRSKYYKYTTIVEEIENYDFMSSYNIENEFQVKEDVEKIVSVGIKTEKNLFRYLKDMIKEIGLKNIFHDKYELTFISIVVIASLIYSMVMVKDTSIHVEDIYKSIFIVSPILYIIISLFSFFNSKEKGTFELEMTCKYNLYQILVLRMFIFSVVTILVNTIIIIGVFTWKNDIDILRAICISITGLFLFSSSFLYITMKVKKEMSKLLIISLWVILNIGLYCINKELYNFFLKEAPIYTFNSYSVMCYSLY